MNNLANALLGMAHRNPDGSYNTQDDRRKTLLLLATQLGTHTPDWGRLHPRQLKARHVWHLVRQWQAQGLSLGTQKNRMAMLRWWAEHAGLRGIIHPENAHYGIGQRTTVATVNKAQVLTEATLAQIANPYIRASLRLQAAFGLRLQECLLLQPHQADQGAQLRLTKGTKGGLPRTIPLTNAGQRYALEEAKALVTRGASMIPADKNLRQQIDAYTAATRAVGLHNLHGTRHAYAQLRYEAESGLVAPITADSRGSLTGSERQRDREARDQVAKELGHGRRQITATYIGSSRR